MVTASVFPSVPTKVQNCKRFYANSIHPSLQPALPPAGVISRAEPYPAFTLLLLPSFLTAITVFLCLWLPGVLLCLCVCFRASFSAAFKLPSLRPDVEPIFLNVYTFDTEGHLTLLTSQTTSDLELNAPSQSIIRPKYKQKCFTPLKLDNCQTKQEQKKNKKKSDIL